MQQAIQWARDFTQVPPPQIAALNAVLFVLSINTLGVVVYATVFGTHPKNAFLSSLFGQLGLITIILALKTQLQSPKINNSFPVFGNISPARAFLDAGAGAALMLLAAYTFLG